MEKSKKNISIFVKHMCLTFFSIIFCGLVGMIALVIVSYIPQKTIYEHTKESVDRLTWECMDSTMFYNRIKGGNLDYFTDFLIINTCFYSAGKVKETVLGTRITGETLEYVNPICAYFNGDKDLLSEENYERYWHEYIIFLRPALILFNLKNIRIICSFINLILTMLVVFLLFKRKEKKSVNLIIPFLAFVICLSPVAISFSLQYYPVFYATIFSIIIILLQNDNSFYRIWYIFLFDGMFVGLFDLLTYPLVSLGVPLIMFFVLNCDEENKLIKQIVNCVMYSASWAIGYAGIYLFRWISSSYISGNNIIQNAFDRLIYRSSHEYLEEHYTLYNTIKLNFAEQCNLMTIVAVAVSIAIFLIMVPFFYSKVNKITIITIILICLYPILWYFALMQHSNTHFWMTYRNMSITIFGMLALLFSFLDYRRKKD